MQSTNNRIKYFKSGFFAEKKINTTNTSLGSLIKNERKHKIIKLEMKKKMQRKIQRYREHFAQHCVSNFEKM